MITRTWDETDPADADEAKYGAQEIRELKADLREIFVGHLRGLEVSYKDADEVYVSSGSIHVYDSAHKFLVANAQITKAITGHGYTDKLVYFYVDNPGAAGALAAADIEYSDTAPTYNQTYEGYYHPTTTDWRFIGSIPVDGSGDLMLGYRTRNGHEYYFDEYKNAQSIASATFADFTDIENFIPNIDNALAIMKVMMISVGNNRIAKVRKNGSSESAQAREVCEVGTNSGERSVGHFAQVVDANGKFEWISGNADTTAYGRVHGYWEPR